MKVVTVPKVVEELVRWITWACIPQEILSNQGITFYVQGTKRCLQDV